MKYSGYRKPHPLENRIEVKVQTNGEINPSAALKEALKNLMDDIDTVTKKFGVIIQKSN